MPSPRTVLKIKGQSSRGATLLFLLQQLAPTVGPMVPTVLRDQASGKAVLKPYPQFTHHRKRTLTK